ncbi:hypothetical protein N7470_002544 [Penicillium chermesinum]|nr:hypothetical protein N7470_002544 [Penicillium chermesinum]
MAFRLPTQAPRRRTSYSAPAPPPLDIPPTSSEQPEDETTQWVLFSPTAHTNTTSTDRTHTAGASRLSDFGSFGTATRSQAGPEEGEVDDDNALDEQLDEEGTELDSLDDGLHEFRAPSLPPASPHEWIKHHLHSFPRMMEQLWQHEQFNPQQPSNVYPQHRRRSSVQRYLDTVDEVEADVERDRWQRIEQWRMDQSRALLQELEKETRRRRTSRASRSSLPGAMEYVSPARITGEASDAVPPPGVDAATDESFWRRITRKVIRDLIGIDDALLSVIFGESLPGEEEGKENKDEYPDMETVLARQTDLEQGDQPDRIAHELGQLVNQLCEHPGAFSTYYQMTKDISNEYAGMSLSRLAESGTLSKSVEPNEREAVNMDTMGSVPSPQFLPTLQDPAREHEAQWGIEDDEPGIVDESARLQQEQEYWERGLDVMMVFKYLRSRFSRRGYMSSDKHTSAPPPRHPQDASRRAAMIRQHHPLVARAHSRPQAPTRRASQYSGVSAPVNLSSPLLRQHLRRPSSSCASQSAKLSAISSRRTMTGSSRNYWDIGGSETNSAIGVGAGPGAWGEV